jgi:fatty acid desaturase
LGALQYVAWTADAAWLVLLSVLLLSVVQAQFAFIGHDASHGSAVGHRIFNRVAGELSMGVIGGLCFREWQGRHLQHHRFCQDESRDPDMQFGTLFSMSAEALLEKTPFARRLGRYQAYYFWPSTLLFAFSLRVSALAAALRQPKRYWDDLLAVSAHIGVFLVAPLLLPDVSIGRVVMVYLLAAMFLGPRLAAVFTVNHVGMPVAEPGVSFFEHQIVTSRNVEVHPYMDWFFGGLNYQIEHHLLPTCPRVQLREARTMVRHTVIAAGYSHHQCGWLQAVTEVTRHMAAVSRDAATSRSPALIGLVPGE